MNLFKVKMRDCFIVALVCLMYSVHGQNQDSTSNDNKRVLTIDECIIIAMENNIQLKRVRNNAKIAKANDFQAIMNFLPSLNGFGNYSLNNGTSFDNSSGQFFTGNRESSFLNLNANLILFNGMRNVHRRRFAASNLDAQQNLVTAQEQDLRSSVLGSYLSVVLDKENIKISEARLELLQAQLSREEQRNSIGVGDLEQVYNFRSQLANENLRLVNLKNRLMTDMLILLQTLQLEVSRDFDVASYSFDDEGELVVLEEFKVVLDASLAYSPSLKSAESTAEAAKYNMKMAKSQSVPTLRLIGDYATQYSSLNSDTLGVTLPISDQYSNLTNKSLEIRMTIPLFQNFRNNTDAQVARINMESAKLGVEQAELDVTNTIQQVYVDLLSAQETYKAAQENLVALTQSFDYVKTRYDNGNTDFYTYLESLNNKNRAEIELVNAKYSIVFRKKILDVYRGLL
ncbi:MAG: TolC family protein [Reichenbachiella sp.]